MIEHIDDAMRRYLLALEEAERADLLACVRVFLKDDGFSRDEARRMVAELAESLRTGIT